MKADVGAGLMEAEIAAYGERFRPPASVRQRVAAGLGGGTGRAAWIETMQDSLGGK